MCVEHNGVLIMSVRHALSHVHEELMEQKNRENLRAASTCPQQAVVG